MVYISQLRIYEISRKALVTNSTFTSFKLWNHWQFSLLAHGCQISENIKAVLSCYLHLTQYVHLIHIFPSFIFYSKYFPCRELLDHSSPIHNLESLLSTLKKLQTFNCDNVYFSYNSRNDVTQLTVIKTEAARFCKRLGRPGSRVYGIEGAIRNHLINHHYQVLHKKLTS